MLRKRDRLLAGCLVLASVLLIGAAWAQAPNQNFIYVSTNCGSLTTPNCYTVNWNTQIVNDATFTASSTTVATTSGDPAFSCGGGSFPCSSGGDVGKYVVGTYDCLTGNPMQCKNEFTRLPPR